MYVQVPKLVANRMIRCKNATCRHVPWLEAGQIS